MKIISVSLGGAALLLLLLILGVLPITSTKEKPKLQQKTWQPSKPEIGTSPDPSGPGKNPIAPLPLVSEKDSDWKLPEDFEWFLDHLEENFNGIYNYCFDYVIDAAAFCEGRTEFLYAAIHKVLRIMTGRAPDSYMAPGLACNFLSILVENGCITVEEAESFATQYGLDCTG